MQQGFLMPAQRVIVVGAVVGAALAVWPSPTETYGLPKGTLVLLAAIAALVAGAIRSVALRRIELPLSAGSAAMAAIVASLAVAVPFSLSPITSFMGSSRQLGLLSYVAYLVLGVTALSGFREGKVEGLLRGMAAAGAVVGIYGILQAFGLQPLPFGILTAPVFATLGNSNFLSGWMAVVTPAALWVALAARSKLERLLAGSLVCLCLAVIIATRSVQGVPAVLAGLLFLIGFRLASAPGDDGRPARRLPTGAALAVGGGLALLVVVGAGSLLAPQAEDGLGARMDYWSAAAKVVGDNPFTGIGTEMFGQVYPAYYEQVSALNYERADDPHSVPLAMFVSGGALAGVAYLAFVVFVALALRKALRNHEGPKRLAVAAVGASWVAYTVQSLVSIDIPPLAVAHWALAGVILAMSGSVRWISWGSTGSVAPGRAARRRGDSRASWTGSQRAAVAAILFVALLLAISATRPMRAVARAESTTDLLGAGQVDQAVVEARKSTELAPWRADSWVALGTALERQGEAEQALRAAERAASLAPGTAAYFLTVGELRQRAQMHDDVLRWFRAAYRAEPRSNEATVSLARALILYGEREEALPVLERALDREPTAELWGLLGRLYALDGRTDLAMRAYQQALRFDPVHKEATAFLRR